MPVAWFIVPYKEKPHSIFGPMRYCAMDDHTPEIHASGGRWDEIEIAGNQAIVKIQAKQEIIDGLSFEQVTRAEAKRRWSHRRKGHKDENGNWVFDGPEQPTETVDVLDLRTK